jgi:ABC-type branched-subunit amino acid transport system ATPase component
MMGWRHRAKSASAVGATTSPDAGQEHSPERNRGADLPGEPLLQADAVTFSYGPVQVLFGVSLRVNAGEKVALLGSNGAGKSTFLRVLSGLGQPTGGRIILAGEDITNLDARQTVSRGIALVPENKAIFPDMTVRDNLDIGLYTLGSKSKIAEERREAVVQVFPRLGERWKQLAGTMSGGEKQMLSLAKALALEPRLLLIDELSLGLSPIVVESLLVAVEQLNNKGTAVLLVEQSLNIAAQICKRAYFLEKGQVQFDGETADLLERPDLAQAVFFGGGLEASSLAVRDTRGGAAC